MKEDILLTEKQINTVLNNIGEEILSFHLFEGGFINPIYFITTKSQLELVLRITNPLPKWRHWKTLNEIEVMKFLRTNTSIPVPKVWDSSVATDLIGYEYILMEKIEGIQMNIVYPDASYDLKCSLISQILSFIKEMQKFTFLKIGSFQENMVLGPNYDIEAGPFESINQFLSAALESRMNDIADNSRYFHFISRLVKLKEKMGEMKLKQFPFVLTQCLEDKNILIKNGKISALLDYEWSGSYPIYTDLMNFEEILQFPQFPRIEKYYREQLNELQLEYSIPENIQDFQEIEFLAMCLGSYKAWFVGKEAEGEEFIQKRSQQLNDLLKKYNC
ncbi:hypothetical protein NEF87_002275 [Candidatus Lokiarchaeum ossiferum]|uniref:Aminoglycoside phosphotransferase domain-containing protein n=1 Tax=Candidatus Lokiarchaeum ossiferum TaxID=2951803 RepID=A0ABY6HR54_9ARCH|nr:hypothetical protein NEF87_002275 [Candidatus Lokiarchaeum sp. B-35]